MAFELIETRNISGRGIIKIPFDKKDYRALKLYIDVVRRPKNIYLNKQWYPDKSFYANLSFGVGDYVSNTRAVYFDRECIDLIPDISGQTLFALKCALDEIFQSFVNLETALGLAHLATYNGIKDFTALTIDWDTIRVQCYADTALQLRLYRLKYEVCKSDDDREEPPPTPPDKPRQVPPGTPLSDANYPVSPPYNGDDTKPFPGDKGDFPKGERCVGYALIGTYELDANGNGNYVPIPISLSVWGEVEGELEVSEKPDGTPGIFLTSHGIIDFDQPCSPDPVRIGIDGITGLPVGAAMRNPTITSFEPL